MEVYIGEIMTTVRAVDSDSLLAPQTLEKIVRIVLEAVREQEEHRNRVRAEQRITGGVHQEMEEDWQ
jgi:hypothetical protein